MHGKAPLQGLGENQPRILTAVDANQEPHCASRERIRSPKVTKTETQKAEVRSRLLTTTHP